MGVRHVVAQDTLQRGAAGGQQTTGERRCEHPWDPYRPQHPIRKPFVTNQAELEADHMRNVSEADVGGTGKNTSKHGGDETDAQSECCGPTPARSMIGCELRRHGADSAVAMSLARSAIDAATRGPNVRKSPSG